MFSFGITKPEMARSKQEIQEILQEDIDYNLQEVLDELVQEGYIGTFDDRYFLLGKGIVAVAAIFT
jgi:disulfide oxidoreductase YuzD